MRRLLKRWYVWLTLVLLLGLAGSVALICSGRGRIMQASFDRIREGMDQREVEAILGESESSGGFVGSFSRLDILAWGSGPNSICIWLRDGRVVDKSIRLATPRETLQWYAKKGAAKIGVKWD
jgi:hypothetical protein